MCLLLAGKAAEEVSVWGAGPSGTGKTQHEQQSYVQIWHGTAMPAVAVLALCPAQVLLGMASTGASSDLESATPCAYKAVGKLSHRCYSHTRASKNKD
jgi:hypothetical protein